MRSYSLTRRLVAAVLLVELCAALVFVAVAGGYEWYAQFRAFDVLLHGRADTLLGAVQDAEDSQDNVMLDGTESLLPANDIYMVIDESGRVLGVRNWPPQTSQRVQDAASGTSLMVNSQRFRVIREAGVRVVDPGSAHGGKARHVTIFYGSPVHPVWERVRNALGFYAATSLVLLVLSGLILVTLVRRGLEPLRQLAVQAAAVKVDAWSIGETGEATRVRELRPLVEALSLALNGLERSFAVQHHAMALQERFVGDAAHELKTAVAVLKSTLQLMQMKSRSADEYAAGLERLVSDCERIEALVASMLTLASLEAGAGSAEQPGVVDLDEALRATAVDLRPVADRAGVRIVIDGGPWEPMRQRVQPPAVHADPEKLRLLVSNLVYNAIQHSAPGGEVHLRAEVRPGAASHLLSAVVSVEDAGEGIPAEALPHVFDRFYRADVSRSRHSGGTGLGLAIAKAIVERLGGEIRLDSVAGRGTTAVVVLPMEASAEMPAPAPVS